MAKKEKLSDQQQVAAFIQTLEAPIAEAVIAIRQIILDTDSSVGERIKWNNPSFYYTGEMKPFDPKEYKREIAVFNLFKGRIMLVFPSGAKIKNAAGLLEGAFEDGRRTTVFAGLADVHLKKEALQNAVKEWLSLVGKD